MNKLIFVILVCLAASAHAGAGVGSLNHILVQVEQHVGAALEAFKAQLVQLIQHFKPELSSILSVLNDFIGKLPQLQASFVEKIKETLVNLVQMVLNGNARGVEGVKEVADQRFFEQLQGLTTHLQTLAVSVVNHLLELLSGKPEMRFLDLSSILNNLNIQGIVDNLQGQLGNIVTNLLGQLLNGKRGFTDFIMNELGLAAVWDQISAMGTGVINQFFAIGSQLLFAGQQIWAQAKVVLGQLLSDLTNHVGDASTIIAQAVASLNQILNNKPTTRGFTDFLMESLGLGGIVSELQNIGSNLLGQLMAKLTQLLFAGQQILGNAKPILAQMVSDLTNHFGDASTIVAQAIQSLTGILGQRGITDMIGNLIGGLNLGSVWTEIQNAGSNLVGMLVGELAQLLVSGQQVINNAKPILQQMISDLTNHFGDASTIVQQAVNQLATVLLNGNSQRNWISNIVSSLGLDAIWDQITAISSDMFAKLMAELAKLLFAGQAVWAQAQELFAQLVSDLTNHVGDASTIIAQAINALGVIVNKPTTRGFTDFLMESLGLGGIVSELQNIGSNLLGQLMAKLTQLLFAGQQILGIAKPILSQMVSDLTNHFGDASTIVAQAIQSLTGILGQRGITDMIGNLIGGLNLGSVWTEIQNAGSNLVGMLVGELAQLLVSGQQVINNAKPILQQMISDLTNHFGDASTIVQQAVNQLATVLLNGQRNWISNIVSSLGLDAVWSQITSIGSDLFGKLMAELTQLLFAGQAVWAQAQEIFGQLASDLTNHVGDASTIIAQAVAALGTILNNGNSRKVMDTRGLGDFILNSLGLGAVWDQIVGLGGNLWSQVLAIGGQLLFAGQQAIANAKPVLAQMVSDLTNHFGDASTIVAQAIASLTQIVGSSQRESRGFFETIGNLLGGFDFSGIVSQLQTIGSDLFGKLMAELTQLLFAGQQVLNNAKPIIAQMISDLTNHFGNASTIVAQAVQALAGVLGQRGITDMISNLIGGLNLSSVWAEIQSAGSNLAALLMSELAQLLVSGQQVINNAKPILQQMISDLTNHFGDASTIVQQAVNQLLVVLANGSNQRNWISNIVSSLGLDAIWDQITAISSDMFAKLMAELAKLLFAGQAVWAQAQELFAQLVSDLTNHVGDASTIIAQAINALGVIVNKP